jgi:hypothetical protein
VRRLQPGFSLHAATVCEAQQPAKLEKLCRYIARPAIANERLSTNERGQVIYKFKQPFRDGTTHVVLEPLDFIARLAALVPRPRLNLTRFHGVFAPNCKHRESVVPKRKPSEKKTDIPLAPMTWMQRLKRVFAIDIETCPKCGGKLRVIACIEDPDVIATILEHIRTREATDLRNTPLHTLDRRRFRPPRPPHDQPTRLTYSTITTALLPDRQVSGGYSVYALAGLFPERVLHAVMIDGFLATGGAGPRERIDANREAVLQMLHKSDRRPPVYAGLDDMVTRVTQATDQTAEAARELVARGHKAVDGGYTWRTDPRIRFQTPLRMPSEQIDELMSRTTAPGLLIVAQQGDRWYRGEVEARKARHPNLTVVEMDGPHHVHLEPVYCAQVAGFVRPFLGLDD